MATRSAARATMKERILETADRLFYHQGIRAVGVDTVAAEIGISKRTLYNHFPSKDELIVAYLMRRFTSIKTSDLPAAEQILGLFDWHERSFASAEFRGCPFVNAVAELGAPTHAARRIAIAYKEQRRNWFREQLSRLTVVNPDGLATQLALLVEGAVATALVQGDPMIARSAREAARTLLNGAGVRTNPKGRASPRPKHRRRARRRSGLARRAT